MKRIDRLDKRINELAENIVNSMFETFQDVNNQGPNFTWAKFPEITKDLARGYTAATFYSIPLDKIGAVEDKVAEKTMQLAKEKIEKHFSNTQNPKP